MPRLTASAVTPLKDYEAGLSVFPLAQGTKTPAVPELAPLLRAPPSGEEVKKWFGSNGVAGYGIACGYVSGGLVVQDFERLEDAEAVYGRDGLVKLAQETRVVYTPHGGVHVYGYYAEVPRRSTKIFGAEHPVDLLGDGGYVCAPGTRIDHARCPRKADGSPKEGCPGEGVGEYTLAGTDAISSFSGDPLLALLNRGRALGWTPRTEASPVTHADASSKLAALMGRSGKVKDLMEGRWQQYGYPSRSEAEEALVVELVRAGLSDDEIRATMEECQIGKWQEKEESYRRLTLQHAHDFLFSSSTPSIQVGSDEAKNTQTAKEEKDTAEEENDLADQIVTEITRGEHFLRIAYTQGNQRDWYWKDGYWRLGAEGVIEKKMVEALERLSEEDEEIGKLRATRNLLDVVIRLIMTKVRLEETDPRLDPPPHHLINLENGILDLNTMQLGPHNPELFFVSKIPIIYDPSKKCPNFMRFLGDVLAPEWHDTVQELFGYCLIRNNNARKAFMLLGSGNNGKSLFLEIMISWIGRRNVSSFSLHQLEFGRFALAGLLGKHLNVFADLPQTPLGKSDIFRILTGGDTIDAEQKFRDSFTFKPYAKLVFSTNRLPPVKEDEVDAFFKRWILIPFERSFADDADQRERIIEACTTDDEKSGILNWAIEGLKRLLLNGHFSNEKQSEEIRETWMRESNPMYDFLVDTIEPWPEGKIEKEELWQKYLKYCEDHGVPPPSRQNEFSILIQTRFRAKTVRIRVNGQRTWCWLGIRYKVDNGPKLDSGDYDNKDDDNGDSRSGSQNPELCKPPKPVQANEKLAWTTPEKESSCSDPVQAVQAKGVFIFKLSEPELLKDNSDKHDTHAQNDIKNNGDLPGQPGPVHVEPENLTNVKKNPGSVNPESPNPLFDPFPLCRAVFDAMFGQAGSAGVLEADFVQRLKEEGITEQAVRRWLDLSLRTWLARGEDGRLRPAAVGGGGEDV